MQYFVSEHNTSAKNALVAKNGVNYLMKIVLKVVLTTNTYSNFEVWEAIFTLKVIIGHYCTFACSIAKWILFFLSMMLLELLINDLSIQKHYV